MTILSLFILTLITGETLPGELMRTSDCRQNLAMMSELRRQGAIVEIEVAGCTCPVQVVEVECRPYRQGATS